VLQPGLKAPAMSERAAVAAALEQALDPIAERMRKVTVVVPDSAIRVLLLDFDTLPPRTQDVLPILRFRLKKLVHFDVEDAAVSWQVLPRLEGETQLRTVLAVMPGAVRAEYEDAVREAGYEPGAILSSSLAALAAVQSEEPTLVVNRNGSSVTTAIVRGPQLLLFRTMDLGQGSGGDAGAPGQEGQAAEELRQTVSVAMAYYEDTLGTPAHTLYSVGPGGAAELERLLALPGVRIRDLISPRDPQAGRAQDPAAGMLAPVVGALAS
jgi:type IV pilus assembly protein PilM